MEAAAEANCCAVNADDVVGVVATDGVSSNSYVDEEDLQCSKDTINLAVECGVTKMEEFSWPVGKVTHDDIELHVVDLHKLRNASNEEQREKLRDLAKVCREWGFFRISNHGVRSDLFRRVAEQTKTTFKLPVEVRRNALSPPKDTELGFISGSDPHIYAHLVWQEALQMYAYPNCIDDIAKKLWTHNEDREEFSSTMKEYLRNLHELALELLHYLTMALDLNSKDYITQCEGNDSGLRLNYYPICPKPGDVLGLNPHADDSVLTIVCEDKVAGLQVQKDNRWYIINPQPDTLIVNVGDLLQVWSNNMYQSAVHRVVVNSQQARISVAFFLYPTDESVIMSSPKLVSLENPAKYKPFTSKDYRGSFYEGDLIENPKSRLKMNEIDF